MNWPAFFDMGGYALYVWTSYGLMALLLLTNAVFPYRRLKGNLRRARRLLHSKKRP